jgi:hypothetical protein
MKENIMENDYEIKTSWKSSEKGRVCFAYAISKNGEVFAEEHITLPADVATELYKVHGNLAEREIENLARSALKFKIDNPELFQ